MIAKVNVGTRFIVEHLYGKDSCDNSELYGEFSEEAAAREFFASCVTDLAHEYAREYHAQRGLCKRNVYGYELEAVSVDEDGYPEYGEVLEYKTYCHDDFRRDEGEEPDDGGR